MKMKTANRRHHQADGAEQLDTSLLLIQRKTHRLHAAVGATPPLDSVRPPLKQHRHRARGAGSGGGLLHQPRMRAKTATMTTMRCRKQTVPLSVPPTMKARKKICRKTSPFSNRPQWPIEAS
jgi:hypothetical protein